MNEYLIGVVHALDMICNYWAVAMFFWILFTRNWEINKEQKILFVIFLLGVIFIPSKETLELLLLNK